jgi:hypothetical protein
LYMMLSCMEGGARCYHGVITVFSGCIGFSEDSPTSGLNILVTSPISLILLVKRFAITIDPADGPIYFWHRLLTCCTKHVQMKI